MSRRGSLNNAAIIQQLFGQGKKMDENEDHRLLVEQLGKRKVTTRWDMEDVNSLNILDKLDDYTRKEYTSIFEGLDDDHSGTITVKEMALAFRNEGLSLTNVEIKELVLTADKNSNGIIELGEFCLIMYQLESGTASRNHMQQYESEPEPPMSWRQKNCPASLERRRKSLWSLVDEPSSSKGARIVSTLILFSILLSSAAYVWETDPEYHRRTPEVWYRIELVCTACFTLEYLCRVCTAPDLIKFLCNGMNAIDLVVILPFYLEIMLGDESSNVVGSGEAEESFNSQSLRALRLFRVFRLFKIGRHVTWLRIFSDTYIASFPPLINVVFVLLLLVVFFASLAHTFEAPLFHVPTMTWMQGDGITSAAVQSIPDAFWFALVSLTTIGYGDVVLSTRLGHVLSMATSLCGVMVLAIPICVISLNFHEQYEANERRENRQQETATRLAALRAEMERNQMRGVVLPIDGGDGGGGGGGSRESSGEKVKVDSEQRDLKRKKNREVVSLLHASADRCVWSMRDNMGNCLIAEQHNRMDLKYELKSMLEQWEPFQKRKQLRAAKKDIRKLLTVAGEGQEGKEYI